MFLNYRFDVGVGRVVSSDQVELLCFWAGVLGFWCPIKSSFSADFVDLTKGVDSRSHGLVHDQIYGIVSGCQVVNQGHSIGRKICPVSTDAPYSSDGPLAHSTEGPQYQIATVAMDNWPIVPMAHNTKGPQYRWTTGP